MLEVGFDEGQLLMVLEGDNLTTSVSFGNTTLDRNVSIQFILQSETATGKLFKLVSPHRNSKCTCAGGEDFEALSPDEFHQTFLSGTDTGTLSLTVLALQDGIVEFSELYQVVLNSSDEAVVFTTDSVQITIVDANIGMHVTSSK